MAAGLAGMVASMCRGTKAYLQHAAPLSEAIARLSVLREELKAAIDADAESYNVVMKAYKAAKESADGAPAISAALQQATAVPLGVAEKAVEVDQIVTRLRPITSPNMKSDLIINLDSLSPDSPEDTAFATQTRKRVVALTEQA
jgi:formiminotetrahydrofolate cyclodeaminase